MSEEKQYKLLGADGKFYMSAEKGTLGGNSSLKIYGRLDCPSTNRFVQLGTYQKVRVFFKDEATAVAAGYRPCGRCMREKYKAWKLCMEKGEAWTPR